jgi:hypothetical protein
MNNEAFTPAQILGYAVINTAAKYLDCRGVSAKALAQADGNVTLRIIAASVAQGRIAYDIAERATGMKVEGYEVRLRKTYAAGERRIPVGQKGYFTEAGKYVAQIDNV